MPKRNVQLIIIDPQNDFCDQAGAALPVAGASADLQRIGALLAQQGTALSQIHVTLDSHLPVDIAHPSWWCDATGQLPAPFTVISQNEVERGVWRARDPAQQAHSLAYVQALSGNQRYQLMIWPEHCLIGSWGQAVQTDLLAALYAWQRQTLKPLHFIHKGSNPRSEHYSALQAEVPDVNDAVNPANTAWLAELAQADLILIAGQALSHCVASTVRDLANALGEAQMHKLVLLTDCTSPVAGFAEQGQAFITEMRARGMQTASHLTLTLDH
ncbi:hypothetical protein [Deefgea salmonis]|uniref:Nicotinamidase/pyrazinamidase n=1 Tax=Deefgea salmonis TaxID=2875502 RepID=A0ABS8BM17_9NEIS|nr:hypothetical protein [Deefgea salmonis]MCB5196770.1 hypothetical protein [Deefgea salmonis]